MLACAKLETGHGDDIRSVRKSLDLITVQQVAGNCPDASTFESLSNRLVAKSRYADDLAPRSDLLQGSLSHPCHARAHLAADPQEHHIPVHPRPGIQQPLWRTTQEILQLCDIRREGVAVARGICHVGEFPYSARSKLVLGARRIQTRLPPFTSCQTAHLEMDQIVGAQSLPVLRREMCGAREGQQKQLVGRKTVLVFVRQTDNLPQGEHQQFVGRSFVFS